MAIACPNSAAVRMSKMPQPTIPAPVSTAQYWPPSQRLQIPSAEPCSNLRMRCCETGRVAVVVAMGSVRQLHEARGDSVHLAKVDRFEGVREMSDFDTFGGVPTHFDNVEAAAMI